MLNKLNWYFLKDSVFKMGFLINSLVVQVQLIEFYGFEKKIIYTVH